MGTTRNTRQRDVIREALIDADRPLSPQELLGLARRRHPGLGVATVYRTLHLLAMEGAIVPVELPGEAARYEVAGKGHHHHFRCRKCRRIFEISGCALAGDAAGVVPPGFRIEDHEVVLYGVCAACAR